MSENGEGKKSYTVSDRRGQYADEQPESAPEPEESGMGSEEDYGAGGEGASREPRIEDAMRLALDAVRRQALCSLGMVMEKGRKKQPDMQEAQAITDMFGPVFDMFEPQFSGLDLTEAEASNLSLADTLKFCFSLMSNQVFLYMGLMAHPATGEVRKDLQQAKMGIDFCNELFKKARSLMDPADVRPIEGMLADMQLNFVNQSK
ncbi:MAG TPA: DUF1844 domain-containing protein [bacterium]|nr:DUF1844 domain-containing protein [bacterium]